MSNQLVAAFLYGQNIPGCRALTGKLVQEMLRPLASEIAFVGIVSRPDSVLLLCDPSLTEQSIREALRSRLACKSVAMKVESLGQIVKEARSVLKPIERSAEPPYRLNIDGAEWQWCLVLCSEELPSSISEEGGLGTSSISVVPVRILNSRALLARKRLTNAHGTRITLGSILNKPWERALKHKNVVPDCLTSRTLNQVDRVVRAAEKSIVGEKIGAKLVPKHHDIP